MITYPPPVLSVVLFGSKARGDNDIYSDTDVFILCEDLDARALKGLQDYLYESVDNAPNYSLYRMKEFRQMLDDGSLFLWHIKLEGLVVYDRVEINNMLCSLKSYSGYTSDLLLYKELLSDCQMSLKKVGVNYFDLSLLFTLARNTCMIMCYRLGVPTFGREAVFHTLKFLLGNELPICESTYRMLSWFKMQYDRGIVNDEPIPCIRQVLDATHEVWSLIELAWRYVDHD